MTIDEVWQVHLDKFKDYRDKGFSRQSAVLNARVDTYAYFFDKGNKSCEVAYMWKKGKERAKKEMAKNEQDANTV